MLETTRVHIVPSANPDGVTTALTQTDGQCNLTQGYTNSHNIDLDTDFKGNTSAVNGHVYLVYLYVFLCQVFRSDLYEVQNLI